MLQLGHEFTVEATHCVSSEESCSLACQQLINPGTSSLQTSSLLSSLLSSVLTWPRCWSALFCCCHLSWVTSTWTYCRHSQSSCSLPTIIKHSLHESSSIGAVHIWSHHKEFDLTWSGTKRLCPPGIFFMMCLSMRSFSRTATPLSIRIGGCAACKQFVI